MFELQIATRSSKLTGAGSRLRDLPVTIRSYLRRRWGTAGAHHSFAAKERATCPRIGSVAIEDVALEVFRLIQGVPDDCKHPHAVFRQLAARAIHDRVEPAAPVRAPSNLLQAFGALPFESQTVLGTHVWAGQDYRRIAQALGMPPEVALRILKNAYSALRLCTSCEQPGRRSGNTKLLENEP